MSSPIKKNKEADLDNKTGAHIQASSPISQNIPILNIPNPGGSSSSKSPNVSSLSQKKDDLEVMVLDDDEEMENEVK